tara:strand:+ start:505 stop:645 length:141 start_codon:yes stop_codon:yes gene_type:complete
MIWMIAGPRRTINTVGKKNTIIGPVSSAGKAPAFFSAAVSLASRFS